MGKSLSPSTVNWLWVFGAFIPAGFSGYFFAEGKFVLAGVAAVVGLVVIVLTIRSKNAHR